LNRWVPVLRFFHTLKINTRGRASKTPKAPLTWDLIERALASYDDLPRERRSAALGGRLFDASPPHG
jgi:hypothetical protein